MVGDEYHTRALVALDGAPCAPPTRRSPRRPRPPLRPPRCVDRRGSAPRVAHGVGPRRPPPRSDRRRTRTSVSACSCHAECTSRLNAHSTTPQRATDSAPHLDKGAITERLPSARMGASASFEHSRLNVIPGEHTETQLPCEEHGKRRRPVHLRTDRVRGRVDHRRAGGDLALPGGRGNRRRVDRCATGTDDAAGADAVRDPCGVEGGPDRLRGGRRRARRRRVRRPTPRAPPDGLIGQPPGPSRSRPSTTTATRRSAPRSWRSTPRINCVS